MAGRRRLSPLGPVRFPPTGEPNIKKSEGHKMAAVSPVRLFTNADRSELVPDGHPDAAFLVVGAGSEVPREWQGRVAEWLDDHDLSSLTDDEISEAIEAAAAKVIAEAGEAAAAAALLPSEAADPTPAKSAKTEVWLAHARSLGLEVADDATRKDLISAVAAAAG